MASDMWFLKANQGAQAQGPFTADQMRALAAKGQVGEGALARKTSEQSWSSAAAVIAAIPASKASPTTAAPAASPNPAKRASSAEDARAALFKSVTGGGPGAIPNAMKPAPPARTSSGAAATKMELSESNPRPPATKAPAAMPRAPLDSDSLGLEIDDYLSPTATSTSAKRGLAQELHGGSLLMGDRYDRIASVSELFETAPSWLRFLGMIGDAFIMYWVFKGYVELVDWVSGGSVHDLSYVFHFVLFAFLYYYISEQSPLRGTPAKWLFGMRLLRENYEDISSKNSLVRMAGRCLFLVLFPFLSIHYIRNDESRQLHDGLSSTVVVKRSKL